MYHSAPYCLECNFLLLAERSSREDYRSEPRPEWREDEIAAVRTALHRITRNRIANANDAEDLVQDTLLTMISRNPGEDLRKGLLVWCLGILRNKVGNYYRKSRRHAGLQSRNPPAPDVASPEITASRKELQSIIEEKLAELPPEIRRVMELLVSGLNAGEIAKRLSPEPYQNVINRLYRGRKKLARELVKCGFGPNSGISNGRKGRGKAIAAISRKVS